MAQLSNLNTKSVIAIWHLLRDKFFCILILIILYKKNLEYGTKCYTYQKTFWNTRYIINIKYFFIIVFTILTYIIQIDLKRYALYN